MPREADGECWQVAGATHPPSPTSTGGPWWTWQCWWMGAGPLAPGCGALSSQSCASSASAGRHRARWWQSWCAGSWSTYRITASHMHQVRGHLPAWLCPCNVLLVPGWPFCGQWDAGAGSTAGISFTSFLFSGALLKAAFICTQVVQFPSQRPLRAQLMESFGGGFEVHTWSKLPHGSGLGRSAWKGLGIPSLVPGNVSCCQH